MLESARASTAIPADEKAPSKTRSRSGPVSQMVRLLKPANPYLWSGWNCILEVKLPVSPPLALDPYLSMRDTLTANDCVGALESLLGSPNITITDTVTGAPC